jgi:hypothetical protein
MLTNFFSLSLSAAIATGILLPLEVQANTQVSSLIAEQIAQGRLSDEIRQQCTAAVEKAVDRLEEINHLDVVDVSTTNLSERYQNFPGNAPLGVTFAMQGRATENVLNSPQLMTTVSTQMISECQPVSWVRFGFYRSDWYVDYGLINNTVAAFDQCSDPSSPGLPNWGEIFCF